jgi:hypothetical protein
MAALPVFPQFRPVTLADRELLQQILWDYQPETSELTFTNLFIWQSHYGFQWSLDGDRLLVVGHSPDGEAWALPPLGPPPLGPPPRSATCRKILEWLREERQAPHPAIERADPRLAAELAGAPGFSLEAVRDQFDYVYGAQDLILLAGGNYRARRNHLHHFQRTYAFSYEPLQERHLAGCRELADAWCKKRRCQEDLNLMGEWEAVAAALANFTALRLEGGVILVESRVQAFSLGELLSQDTAVIHLEKANPIFPGLYAAINQQFCEHAWGGATFINREQDLGEPGLRTAKLSYHPHHLVEKFRIRLA